MEDSTKAIPERVPPLPFSIGKRAKAIQMFFIFIIEKGPARESGRIYPCPFKKKKKGGECPL